MNHPPKTIKAKRWDQLSKSEAKEWLRTPANTALWGITKDQILVCKDCEFRYMCLDDRIPLPHASGEAYYHEDSCGYNPYLGIWKDQEGFEPAPPLGK